MGSSAGTSSCALTAKKPEIAVLGQGEKKVTFKALEAEKEEEPSSSSCSSGEEACRGIPLRSQQSGGHGKGKLLEY
jgi:hypothetical protein